MKVLDLFSGIGGFSLGLERAGHTTIAFCEIESFPQKVLNKWWPSIPEIICGGFPCQDISTAGKGAGLAGERSGLWRDMLRTIRLVRPRYAIVENVAALLHRGMGTVLGDLAKSGYDTEWGCISAADIGAPHKRERIWIVAHTSCFRRREIGSWEFTPSGEAEAVVDAAGIGYRKGREQRDFPCSDERPNGELRPELVSAGSESENLADTRSKRRWRQTRLRKSEVTGRCQEMANAKHARLSIRRGIEDTSKELRLAGRISCDDQSGVRIEKGEICNTNSKRLKEFHVAALPGRARLDSWRSNQGRVQWEFEPQVGRVADGVPDRVDCLKGLGNAVVPGITEIIGGGIK